MIHSLDIGLLAGLIERFIGRHTQLLPEAGPRLVRHDFFELPTRGNLVLGHMVLAHRNLNIAALGDHERVLHGIQMVVKNITHFVAIFDEETTSIKAEPLLVRQIRGGSDAEQRIVMRVVVFF